MSEVPPRSDNDFGDFASHFLQVLSNYLTQTGITAAELAALHAKLTAWQSADDAHKNAQSAARTAAEVKNEARRDLERDLRLTVARAQVGPAVTDAIRTELGITVRDKSRTPTPVPSTRPVGELMYPEPLIIEIEYRDEATSRGRARPKGYAGCRVFYKLGAPPANYTPGTAPADMLEAAQSTASPAQIRFQKTDAGKPIYILLAWVNTTQEMGPYAEMLEGTVPG